MATGAISLRGEDLYCALADGGPEARIPSDRGLPRLREWAERSMRPRIGIGKAS